jgi:hypothetical protein
MFFRMRRRLAFSGKCHLVKEKLRRLSRYIGSFSIREVSLSERNSDVCRNLQCTKEWFGEWFISER